MTPRTRVLGLAALAALLSSGALLWARGGGGAIGVTRAPAAPSLVAGPGRVEPISEEIKIGSELSGKLRTVNVDEGDRVRRGDVLAELENDDYAALVATAEAEVGARQAALRKVLHGARAQERSEALAAVNAAEAVLDNARAENDRYHRLFSDGVVSYAELDRYVRHHKVAAAEYRQARERHSLIDDRAREEDRALARADLAAARARLEEARARHAKTIIRSPIDGTVLRKHHRDGESVSNSATVPDPIVTVGDKRVLRVRVEIDETEVNRVAVGHRAYVTADAFAGREFGGQVIRIGQQLGRKNIQTAEPTERLDTRVLEVLVELAHGAELPIGLRVDAYVVVEPGPKLSQRQPAR
jgi:HlyD family secretion protein